MPQCTSRRHRDLLRVTDIANLVVHGPQSPTATRRVALQGPPRSARSPRWGSGADERKQRQAFHRGRFIVQAVSGKPGGCFNLSPVSGCFLCAVFPLPDADRPDAVVRDPKN